VTVPLEYGVPPPRGYSWGTNSAFDDWRAGSSRLACVSLDAALARNAAWEVAEAKRARGGLILAGVAVRYNVRHLTTSPAGDCMYDNFKTGCFTEFLTSGVRPTKFDRMHEHAGDRRYGGTDDGRLQLSDGPAALLFKLDIDETDSRSMGLFDQVLARSLPAASIGFFPADFHFEEAGDGWKTRVVTEGWLGEISAVTHGAVPGTNCHAIDERYGQIDIRETNLAAFNSACAGAQVSTALGRLRDVLDRAA
jgi:HK97 family phage prohead protease